MFQLHGFTRDSYISSFPFRHSSSIIKLTRVTSLHTIITTVNFFVQMNLLGQTTVMFALVKGSQYQCLQVKSSLTSYSKTLLSAGHAFCQTLSFTRNILSQMHLNSRFGSCTCSHTFSSSDSSVFLCMVDQCKTEVPLQNNLKASLQSKRQ